MNISDIKPNTGKIEVVGVVQDKQEPKEFVKFGKTGKLCNATLKDDSGQIKITLWEDQVDKVNEGDRIQITNGWCGEFRGESQLSTGKFGQLDIVEMAGTKSSPSESTESEVDEENIGE